jgi:hypothetical protein
MDGRSKLISLFHGAGVEIGVYEAAFSADMLKRQPAITMLNCVDPWLMSDGTRADRVFRAALAALRPHADRCAVMRMRSARAARMFADGSVDFAYIDGGHRYRDVVIDLDSWLPKVKPGGILSGHDYKYFGGNLPGKLRARGRDLGRCEVKAAVDDWLKRNGLRERFRLLDSLNWIITLP